MDKGVLPTGESTVPEKIFLLEDDVDIAYILEILLSEEGYDVYVFHRLKEILAGMSDLLPDLFLLDVMLPDGDGIDLCNQIKADSRCSGIPVLIMSAHADMKKINTCKPDGFIAKPFDLNEIINMVKFQLSGKA